MDSLDFCTTSEWVQHLYSKYIIDVSGYVSSIGSYLGMGDNGY